MLTSPLQLSKAAGILAAMLVVAGCDNSTSRFDHPWRASTHADSGAERHGDADAAVRDASDDALEQRSEQTGAAAAMEPTHVVPAFSPVEPVLPKLTVPQYANAIRDLLGPALTVPDLEPDQRPYNFANIGASQTTLSEVGVDLYMRAAFSLAREAFADPERRKRIVVCEPGAPLDPACLHRFLEVFGRRVFRRALSAEELTSYEGLARDLKLDDPWQTLEYLTATLLQSPHFLYRVELGEPDSDNPKWRRYTGYEIASRLAFLLRNTIPDDALLAAAESGDLDTREGVEAAAKRLLDDSTATEQMVADLYTEYLDLSRLDAISFPKEMNPSGEIGKAMRTEVIEMVKRIALRDHDDMRTLFTTRFFAPNAELSALYGVESPSKKLPAGGIELPPDSPRAGILTTGALLALNNRPNRTSPTIRGLFIRQRLLCGTVPPPPPGIPAIAEQMDGEPVTIREKLEQHRANPACAACHRSMDPIGLGMEDFDQFGRHRTEDANGTPIDATGDVDGMMFTGARELGMLLSEDPRVASCLVKQLYRFGAGRLESSSEEEALLKLDKEFAANGYQLKPLLVALVSSDGFRFTTDASE